MAATRLSFSYPEDMKRKLLILAKKDNRSLSSYVQNILSDHIDVNKPAPKKKKVKKSQKSQKSLKV